MRFVVAVKCIGLLRLLSALSIDRAHILLDNISWCASVDTADIGSLDDNVDVEDAFVTVSEGGVATTEDILWKSGSGKQNLVERL